MINTKSLNLPFTEIEKLGKVALVYAPEKGQPSPLFQLKVGGTQRCQVIIKRWGLDAAKKIGLQLYNDFVSGNVELKDIYSWRNSIEAEVQEQPAAADQPQDLTPEEARRLTVEKNLKRNDTAPPGAVACTLFPKDDDEEVKFEALYKSLTDREDNAEGEDEEEYEDERKESEDEEEEEDESEDDGD